MDAVLVDSNVILDVVTNDPTWGDWSAQALERTADAAILVINPLVYAEVSIGFDKIEDLEAALPIDLYRREAQARQLRSDRIHRDLRIDQRLDPIGRNRVGPGLQAPHAVNVVFDTLPRETRLGIGLAT